MRLSGCAALVVGTMGLAAMDAAPAQQQPPPVFGVGVRLIAVPVFVTDKNGKAVTDLTAADFDIEDQGRSVPVTGFLAVDAAAPSPMLPAASPVLAAASRRQFLLLFDLSFSSPPALLKARRAALELLEKGLQPGDLLAVASVGPAGMRVLTAFTPDREQAARAVATLGIGEGLKLRDPLGLAYDIGLPLVEWTGRFGLLADPASELDAELMRQLRQLSRIERGQYKQRVVSYIGELQGLGQLLDSIQGRKQVILLSAGFDQSLLGGAQATEQAENARAVTEGRLWDVQGDRHFGDATTRDTLNRLFEVLTRSDTVVHSVSLAGVSAGGSLEEMGAVPQSSGRETLAELAGRSGGRFVRETGDLTGALREVLAASSHYYVLAFEPLDSKKKPGELRKLKVKVKRAGLEVSHRGGYTLPDPNTSAEPTRQLQAAEMIAKGLSGGALRLHALAVPSRTASGQLSLPVVLEIEGESLLAQAGGGPLSLEVYGYALDGHGRIQDAVSLTPVVDLRQLGASVRRQGVQVLTAFRVAEGPVDLRFLVRERASERSGTLRLGVEMPGFREGTRVLSPPLLMDDPRARVVIPTPSLARPELEIPFRLEQTAFTPQAAPVLRNGESREVCVMVSGPVQGLSPALEANLIPAEGRALPQSVSDMRIVEDADGMLRVVFSLTPSTVPPGDYRLRLLLRSEAQAEAASELMVRVQ